MSVVREGEVVADEQFSFLATALPLLFQELTWDHLLEVVERAREIEWGSLVYKLFSVFFVTFFAPTLKVMLLTLVAATLRVVSIYFFGEEEMARVVGSEGYVYYAYVLLGNYIGFGPIFRLFNSPVPEWGYQEKN